MWRCMDNACRNMCSHHPEDTNRDGTIQFDEFLRYVGKLGQPITCIGFRGFAWVPGCFLLGRSAAASTEVKVQCRNELARLL